MMKKMRKKLRIESNLMKEYLRENNYYQQQTNCAVLNFFTIIITSMIKRSVSVLCFPKDVLMICGRKKKSQKKEQRKNHKS